MDSLNILYTWLDIETIFLKQRIAGMIPGDVDVKVYSDGIDVYLGNTTIEEFKGLLGQMFGDWYERDSNVIFLKSPQEIKKFLPIQFEKNTDIENQHEVEFYPLFQDAVLFSDSFEFKSIERNETLPQIITFYSFKGGVGRTLHLVAALKALLTNNDSLNKQILVVDADLEAPGLTWWVKNKKELPEISYLDLLAIAQYDQHQDYRDSVQLAVEALTASPLTIDKYECYFLPAFRTEEQLMRFPVRPEHLVRRNDYLWENTDLILDLGKALGVRYILVDLRAGLSELSAPLLFDARALRFLVTTYSSQSISGIKIVLSQLAKLAPNSDSNLFDPFVIFSMLPEELKESPEILEAQSELLSAYPDFDDAEDDATPPRLSIVSTFFAHELLYFEGINQLWHKLTGTSVFKQIQDSLEHSLYKLSPDVNQNVVSAVDISGSLGRLETLCTQLEHAESGEGKGYLPIQAIRNLGQRFIGKMPLAVVVGSKGAGKTYLFLQLARFRSWDNFLLDLNIIQNPKGKIRNLVFPFLESRNLKDRAQQQVVECRENVWKTLDQPVQWNLTMIRDQIREHLKQDYAWNQSDWRKFWIHLIGQSLGLHENQSVALLSLDDIQKYLKQHDVRVTIIIDGLEDLFPKVKTEPSSQEALNGLLEIPESLRELRESYLGIVCFIRRDILRSAIKQNVGQFEARYDAFDLTWNYSEALRLTKWIADQAQGTKDITIMDLITTNYEDLSDTLVPFWGRKLGSHKSREAIASNWVLAALSDFNGQLQARDLVRFIRYAAQDSVRSITYLDRLLQPASIRRAIEPCSRKKIEEFEYEVVTIKGIFDKLRSNSEEGRRIPFTANKFDLSVQEIELLEALGVIRKEKEKYYIPEIFRYGLGFSLDRRARPTVLSWKRRV